MIYLFTGVTGHGKTLGAIQFTAETLNPNNDRQVFYHNIKDLTFDWTQIDDPKTWEQYPDNSIFFFDEAQENFPQRDHRKSVPDYISALEKHRHRGIDFVLVTQHPKFLDVHVRRLVFGHYHLERKFGFNVSTKYQWDKCIDEPEKDYHARQKAQVSPWKYPKKYFGTYKSATLHTAKKKIPKKFYWLIVLVPMVIIPIYSLSNSLLSKQSPQSQQQESSSFLTLPQHAQTQPQPQTMSVSNYIDQFQPRIPDMPMTAPFYDEVYKAKTFPRPNCITNESRERCTCYSQQATKMNISHYTCLKIVDNGLFDPTIEENTSSNKNAKIGS